MPSSTPDVGVTALTREEIRGELESLISDLVHFEREDAILGTKVDLISSSKEKAPK